MTTPTHPPTYTRAHTPAREQVKNLLHFFSFPCSRVGTPTPLATWKNTKPWYIADNRDSTGKSDFLESRSLGRAEVCIPTQERGNDLNFLQPTRSHAPAWECLRPWLRGKH